MAFDIDYALCVIVMAILTGVYVIVGGYMATAINDFIQGIIMIVGIIAVIGAVLKGQGGFLAALDKLDGMRIDTLLTAHDYHPYGWRADGETAVTAYVDACRQALNTIKKLVLDERGLDDEALCKEFEALGNPHLGTRIPAAMRAALASGALN